VIKISYRGPCDGEKKKVSGKEGKCNGERAREQLAGRRNGLTLSRGGGEGAIGGGKG